MEGITLEIMEAALRQAADGRRHILAQMGACDPPPRGELGPYTPRILIVTVRVLCHRHPFGAMLSVISVCVFAASLQCFVRSHPEKSWKCSCLQLRMRCQHRLSVDIGMMTA